MRYDYNFFIRKIYFKYLKIFILLIVVILFILYFIKNLNGNIRKTQEMEKIITENNFKIKEIEKLEYNLKLIEKFNDIKNQDKKIKLDGLIYLSNIDSEIIKVTYNSSEIEIIGYINSKDKIINNKDTIEKSDKFESVDIKRIEFDGEKYIYSIVCNLRDDINDK